MDKQPNNFEKSYYLCSMINFTINFNSYSYDSINNPNN